MTRKVVNPIALDKSINTTEQTPRNIADVLAQQLAAIKTAIESGNGNLEAAFVCYYGVTTATQINQAIEDGKVPYFYFNGVVAQLWKVETNKYTFRTTNNRSVAGQTILDLVDYIVNGSVWSTVTREVSGGSSSGQSYITSVNSLADFDTTGKSGMQDLVSVENVPADGVYQVSVMLHITPKAASATKSDLVLQFTSSDNTGWPSHTFHAVVDDSQTFAQQLSFSTSVSLKAGQNTLRIQCGGLNTEYLVLVDELTVAQLVNGVYHNGDDFADVHTLTEAAAFNNDDGVLVDGATGGPRFMLWQTLANNILGLIPNAVYSLGQKAAIDLYNSSPNTSLDADGNAVPLEGSTLYRYSLEDNSSGVVYVDDGVCVFSTTTSASTKLTSRLSSGFQVVPGNANYILCASMSESKAYNVNFEESATKQGLDEVSSTADTALAIGTDAASVANEAVLDAIAIASKEVTLEYYNTSPQTDIQPDGTAGSNVNSYIARYDVQQYVGRRLCITTDDGYCFSASTSAVDHITEKLYAKTIEVPSGANVLLISASNGTDINVFVIEESARKADIIELETDILAVENDVIRVERNAMRFSDPLPAKNTSVGNRIKDDGSVEANAGYYLIRYNVAPFVGKKLQIDSNYNYCFSTSDSATGHITAGLRDNIIQVPTGAVTLIVSSTTGYPINCREVNPISKYGQFGIQFRSTMEFSQRVGDAVGMSFSLDAGTGTAVSDFDKCYPWCDMRLCNIANPTGNRSIIYEGETGFSYSADTFVEVPKFYFKRSYDSVTETETWVISDKGGDGFVVEPWFLDSDGKEVPVRYIARYNLGQNISRTGEAPYIQATFDNLKTKCETAGFNLSDIYAYQAIMHLFAVEIGIKDSQSVFPGVSYYRYYADPSANTMQNSSASTNTIILDPNEDYRNAYFGVGDRVMIFTGSSTAYDDAIFRHLTDVTSDESGIALTFDGAPISLTQGVSRIYGVSQQNGRTDGLAKTCRVVGGDPKTRPFSYRGIENLYGNIGEAVDRIAFDTNSNRLVIDGKRLSFVTPQNSSYVEQLTIPKWIRYFGQDPMYPTLTLPKGSLTATIDNSYTDEWSTFGSADSLHLVYSCAWDHLNGNGLFCYRALTEVNNQLYSGRAML